MENYSRKQRRTSNEDTDKKRPTEKISKGLTAFQKILATIGSFLGIITASITILTYMNNHKKTETQEPTTATTTIIKEVEKTGTENNASTATYETETSSSSENTSQASSSEVSGSVSSEVSFSTNTVEETSPPTADAETTPSSSVSQ